jgi:hypothetical protein
MSDSTELVEVSSILPLRDSCGLGSLGEKFACCQGTATDIQLTHEQLPGTESRGAHGHGRRGAFDKLEKYLLS